MDDGRAGPRGPVLLQDHHLREKITHFDHERIPERVVHARGAAAHGAVAHGVFRGYGTATRVSKAAFLAEDVETPVFVRFSTVLGSRGSADTVRDTRGFATKFYTSEGVFDLVGNTTMLEPGEMINSGMTTVLPWQHRCRVGVGRPEALAASLRHWCCRLPACTLESGLPTAATSPRCRGSRAPHDIDVTALSIGQQQRHRAAVRTTARTTATSPRCRERRRRVAYLQWRS